MAPLTASAMASGSARAPLPTSPHASVLLICTRHEHIHWPVPYSEGEQHLKRCLMQQQTVPFTTLRG